MRPPKVHSLIINFKGGSMLVVVDLESETRDVLGIYVGTEEDSVSYNDWETGELCWAPDDCVLVTGGYIAFQGPRGLKESASV